MISAASLFSKNAGVLHVTGLTESVCQPVTSNPLWKISQKIGVQENDLSGLTVCSAQQGTGKQVKQRSTG